MFNKLSKYVTHRDNKQTRHILSAYKKITRANVVSLVITLPILSLFLLPLPSLSFSLDTAILDLYNQAIHSKSLHSFPKAKEEGDLFKKLYQNQHADQTIAFQEGIDMTYDIIRDQGGAQCGIEKSHIHDILFWTNTEYRQNTQINIQEQLANTDVRGSDRKNNINNICVIVTNCLADPHKQKITNATTRTIAACSKLINNTYRQAQGIAMAHAKLKKSNEGDQRFENGTLDDSSFDLLLDMQNIGDIMFGNNKKVPELLFYQQPSRNTLPVADIIPGSQDATGSTTTGNTPTAPSAPSFPFDDIRMPYLPTTSEAREEKEIPDTSDDIIEEILQQNPHSTQAEPLGVTVFGPNRCLIEEDETTPGAENTTGPTWEEYQEALEGYTDSLDPIDDRINDFLLSGNQSNGTGSGSGTGDGNTDPTDQDIEELQESDIYQTCKDECSDLAFSDQVLCMAECLCGIRPEEQPERAQDLLTFNLRFCMIPAQATTSIVASKTVMSIEEIIDEINNILNTLQGGGEMGKHNHTTEFLDSSLQNIKLSELLVFNLAIAFKPIYNTIPDSVIKKEREQKNIIKEDAILYNKNRNKYLTIADPIHQAMSNQKVLSSDHYDQLYQKQQLLQASQQTNREWTLGKNKTSNFAVTETIINDFITNNVRFWSQINEIMHNIQETTLSLKNKIEKAP